MGEENKTPFSSIYENFLSRVTSDMYMEMTEKDTYEQLQGLLVNAIPRCKLPKFKLFDYELGYLSKNDDEEELSPSEWIGGNFNTKLLPEEINLLSLGMLIEWFWQQLATTENTKAKYSGSDFKFTSQANHMAKLKVMIDKASEDFKHLQDIYKRTKRAEDGSLKSTLGQIMEVPDYGYKI